MSATLLTACHSNYDERIELFDLTITLTAQDNAGYSFEASPVELRGINRHN